MNTDCDQTRLHSAIGHRTPNEVHQDMGENQDGSLNHNSSFSLPSTKPIAVNAHLDQASTAATSRSSAHPNQAAARTTATQLPGNQKPSRRNSRRAAPTFTWVMFRVSRLWWPSPTPSRNNGSRSLTWSRAYRLTLPPVMRVPLCRVYLIGSSSLRSPQPNEPTSLTSTRLASPYRTSAPASTSRKTPSSACASRLASLNGSAVSMSLKATRPNQCTPLASPS